VVGDGKWDFLVPCSWLARVVDVGGYVLTGIETQIKVLSCIFLYFCGC